MRATSELVRIRRKNPSPCPVLTGVFTPWKSLFRQVKIASQLNFTARKWGFRVFPGEKDANSLGKTQDFVDTPRLNSVTF